MERLELAEKNRREIDRRVEKWDYYELNRWANWVAQEAPPADTDQAEARSEMKDATGAVVLFSEVVTIEWDATAGAWFLVGIERTQVSTLDGLSGDYSSR